MYDELIQKKKKNHLYIYVYISYIHIMYFFFNVYIFVCVFFLTKRRLIMYKKNSEQCNKLLIKNLIRGKCAFDKE